MLTAIALAVALGIGSIASADEVSSGPEVGSKLAALKVTAAVGENLGESIDAITEREGKPTVYVFVRASEFDRPMARVIKGLDDAITRGLEGAKDAAVVAVWVTDTPEKSREYLPVAQQSLKLQKTRWTVFEGGKLGPEGWSLNDSAGLTIVVGRDGKVAKSTGYTSWNESDIRKILRALIAS